MLPLLIILYFICQGLVAYNLHFPTISCATGLRRVFRNMLKSDALWYTSDDGAIMKIITAVRDDEFCL